MKILLLSREQDYFTIYSDLLLFGKVDYHFGKLSKDICSYDLIISYCYGPILKNEEISQLKGPVLNLHPSYLPYGRGIYPILWGVANNHPLGSTIHLIENSEIDNGSILLQEELKIRENMTLRQIHLVLTTLSRNLLNKLLIAGFPKNYFPNKIKPDLNISKKMYRNKLQGELFFNLLPKKWETSAREVREIYKANEIFISGKKNI